MRIIPTRFLHINVIQRFLGDRNTFLSRVGLTSTVFLGTAVLNTVTGLLIARLLGPLERGEFAAMQSWVLLLGSIVTLGMQEAVVYYCSRYPDRAREYLSTAYIPMAIMAIMIAGLGWLLMPLMLSAQPPEIIESGRFLLLAMIPVFCTFVPYEALRAYGMWQSWNLLRILPNLIWLMVLLVAYVDKSWANPIVLSRVYPIIFISQSIPAIIILLRRDKPRFTLNLSLLKPLLGYGLPTAVAVLPRTFNLRLDQLMMAAFLDPKSLGLYVAAVAWSGATTPIFTAISQVLFPELSAMKNGLQQINMLSRMTKWIVALNLVITIAFIFCTPSLFPLIFGTDYTSAVPSAILLVIANAFAGTNLVLTSVLRGFGKPRNVLIAEMTGLLMTVITLAWLLPTKGYYGAAMSSLCAYATVTIILAVMVGKKMTYDMAQIRASV
jgi:O-antigen/teichoic acid export membrane protein